MWEFSPGGVHPHTSPQKIGDRADVRARPLIKDLLPDTSFDIIYKFNYYISQLVHAL